MSWLLKHSAGVGGGGGGGRGVQKSGFFKSGTGYGGDKQRDGQLLKAGLKSAGQKEQQFDKDTLMFLQNIIPSGIKTNFDRIKLVQVLQDVFHNQILTDWNRRNKIYCQALDVCEHLAMSPDDDLSAILNTPLEGPEDMIQVQESSDFTVCSCLKGFADLASTVVSITQKNQLSNTQTCTICITEAGELRLAEKVLRVYELVKSRVGDLVNKQKKNAAILSITTPEDSYRSQLGPLRFGLITSFSTQQHYFLSKTQRKIGHLGNDQNGILSPQLTCKLFKELASYKTVLPIEYGSSVFVRALDSRLDMVRVLIIGSDDTPYANGCYIFDIQITSSYPSQPPMVQFVNHGNASFNPNLYNCGKVCLSLLGTWSGPGWVAGTSTLLQVLISIQSLILVADPFFNEPGYESQLGTDIGRQNSSNYNSKIRQYTLSISMEPFLHALARNQPSMFPEFDDAIRLHYILKNNIIKKQVERWAEENVSLRSSVDRVLGYLKILAPSPVSVPRSKKRNLPTAVNYHVNQDGVIEIDNDLHVSSSAKKLGLSNEIICLDHDDVELALKSSQSLKSTSPTVTSSRAAEVVDLT